MKPERFTVSLIVSVLSLAISSPAGEDTNLYTVSTVSGVTYTNVTVQRVDPDGLTFMTGKGVTRIPFTNLPLDWQQKYNYDQAAAATFRQQQDDARLTISRKQQVTDSAIKNTIRNAVVWVNTILDETSAMATVSYSEEEEEPTTEWKTVPDNTKPKKPGVKQSTKRERVQSTRTVTRTRNTVALVVGIPKNIGEREKFESTVYRAGRYTVPDNATTRRADGARIGTVLPRFATSAELASKLLSEDQ